MVDFMIIGLFFGALLVGAFIVTRFIGGGRGPTERDVGLSRKEEGLDIREQQLNNREANDEFRKSLLMNREEDMISAEQRLNHDIDRKMLYAEQIEQGIATGRIPPKQGLAMVARMNREVQMDVKQAEQLENRRLGSVRAEERITNDEIRTETQELKIDEQEMGVIKAEIRNEKQEERDPSLRNAARKKEMLTGTDAKIVGIEKKYDKGKKDIETKEKKVEQYEEKAIVAEKSIRKKENAALAMIQREIEKDMAELNAPMKTPVPQQDKAQVKQIEQRREQFEQQVLADTARALTLGEQTADTQQKKAQFETMLKLTNKEKEMSKKHHEKTMAVLNNPNSTPEQLEKLAIEDKKFHDKMMKMQAENTIKIANAGKAEAKKSGKAPSQDPLMAIIYKQQLEWVKDREFSEKFLLQMKKLENPDLTPAQRAKLQAKMKKMLEKQNELRAEQRQIEGIEAKEEGARKMDERLEGAAANAELQEESLAQRKDAIEGQKAAVDEFEEKTKEQKSARKGKKGQKEVATEKKAEGEAKQLKQKKQQDSKSKEGTKKKASNAKNVAAKAQSKSGGKK